MKKEKKLNNKGFTLIEVLAVIVILVIIVSIAIPNISASLDRQSCTIMENRGELIASAAQFYVSDNRGTVKSKADAANPVGKCKITTDKLDDNNEYITAKDLEDNNGNSFSGYVVYNQNDESYTFCFDPATDSTCNLNAQKKDASDNPICTDHTTTIATCY